MKKILFGVIMLATLIGCGKNYETYTPEEKYNMIVRLQEVEKKSELTKEEEEFKKEMRNLLTTLKIESQKDNDAKKEFDEWKDAVEKYQKEEIKRLKEKAREEAEKSKLKISF
ncbi:hypothetical protein HMPREF2775_05000 [Fusobacterium sp. HMSC064B12]|uniref:hypothetical protein n=1 Tax=Fusobacterium sp. HMSC064B12 TaxID=1739279 RepID=UPI0008A12F19|nr:hypothetical protein [Fusobacterium sp. HMSC064B12]OFL29766.1 hypothetical protein HMPREF2775_05000 [Fusobacterium sp. HMSC064B12]